jgi:hypothetical protein
MKMGGEWWCIFGEGVGVYRQVDSMGITLAVDREFFFSGSVAGSGLAGRSRRRWFWVGGGCL